MKYIENFKKLDKNLKLIFIILPLSIILFFASSIIGDKKTSYDSQTNDKDSSKYVEYIESKIHKIVSSIENVGKAEIMVTLESDVEYVYAQEEKTNSDTTTSKNSEDVKTQNKDTYEGKVIVIDKNGNRDALIKTKLDPKVKGVVIVCEGGDNYKIQAKVLEAVTTALNISSARVSIIGGKK